MRRLKLHQYDLDRKPLEKAILKYRDRNGKHEVELSCGTHDEVEVFREGLYTYALSWNTNLGYVGVERFKGSTLEGDLFLQDSQHIEECLGRSGLDLTPLSIVKRLAEYL